MTEKAKYYIEKLMLQKHPEGGYFKEIYRAGEIIEADLLPGRYGGDRSFSTSIYFLLDENQVSKFHKLKSDEIWHFYDGSAIKIYIIHPGGTLEEKLLGNKLEDGETLQTVIGKGNWFGAELVEKNKYGLIGCTVAPGFDFNDFEMGDREKLLTLFPLHSEFIKKLS